MVDRCRSLRHGVRHVGRRGHGHAPCNRSSFECASPGRLLGPRGTLWVVRASHPPAWLRARLEGRPDRLLQPRFPRQRRAQGLWVASELRCPSCATLYRGDARHLVRAGLEGGKGVDESVANHPAVFMTLTAPGFGAVHRETPTGVPAGTRRAVSARPPLCVSGPARPRRRDDRHTAVLPLLRLRRRRVAQAHQRRAVAAHHHLRRPPVGHVARDVTSRVRQGASPRARQSGRVPTAWPGALPCRGPGRRP